MFHHRYKIICKFCGKEDIKNNKSITCSLECRDKLQKKRFVESAPIGKCGECGKKDHLPYEINELQMCSKRCKNACRARERRAIYKVRYVRKKLPKSLDCRYCGKSFKPYTTRNVYCSQKCSNNDRYHNRGRNKLVRLKTLEFHKKIGFCRLCGVTFEELKTPFELGVSKRKNGHFHKDHIKPKARGGEKGKTRWLCWYCNMTRGSMRQKYDSAIAKAGKAFWKAINE
jgi:hypothetical protein